MGINENQLRLLHYNGHSWDLVAGTTIDATDNLLIADGLTSFSDYAIATGAVPEPSTILIWSVLGVAGCFYTRASRRRKGLVARQA